MSRFHFVKSAEGTELFSAPSIATAVARRADASKFPIKSRSNEPISKLCRSRGDEAQIKAMLETANERQKVPHPVCAKAGCKRRRRARSDAPNLAQLRGEFIGLKPLPFLLTLSPADLKAPQNLKFIKPTSSENRIFGTPKLAIHWVFKQIRYIWPAFARTNGWQSQPTCVF